MDNNSQKILILAPHPDDGEFGCGGTIAKFVEEGREVYYATFSPAEESVPEGLPGDVLFRELQDAGKILGIKPDNVLIYKYPVRKLALHRQDILEDLVKLKNDLEPDLVLMPSSHDLHQDHATVAQEGLRAFKFTSILGYEMPWNNVSFTTTAFIYLDEEQVEKKLAAVKCYLSQTGRKYAHRDFIYGLAKTRGIQIGVDFAETFEVVRWVIK